MTPNRLPRHWTLACACALVLAGLAPAVAQFLPRPGPIRARYEISPAPGQSGAFPPPPGQGGMQQGGAQAGPPPGGAFPPPSNSVRQQFPPIRQAAEQGAAALRSAGERKAPREEVCGLFKSFVVKEARLIKFLVDNKTACGVPDQAITGAKANHAKSQQIAKHVCGAAGADPRLVRRSAMRSAAPTLPRHPAKQPGTGTFDTLTGNPVAMSEPRRPRRRFDRKLGRHARAGLAQALSAAGASRPPDRLVAAAAAVLVVGRARGDRGRPPGPDPWHFAAVLHRRRSPCAAPAAPGTTSSIATSTRRSSARVRGRSRRAGERAAAFAFLVAQALVGLLVLVQFNRFAIWSASPRLRWWRSIRS